MSISRHLLAAALLGGASASSAQSATLAVVQLNSNTSNPEATWISRGLADMLTTDLSKISQLTVVQREQLDKVLKEQALGTSGAVDPGKAAQLGKVLGARTLLTGSYAAIGRKVRVDLQLINTATGRVEGGVSAEGTMDSIFDLEKQLVLAVISKLGVMATPAEMQAILQPETLNNQAVILNYQALGQLQKDPKAAAAALQQAVALDPGYASAQQNLRTALGLSGMSIANAALLDIDLKSQELQAARQAAEIIKAGVRISDVKLGEPTTKVSEPGMVTVGYGLNVTLAPGTLAAVAKVLEPFSREGKNRSSFMLQAPGIGRGDRKFITLANESVEFLQSYLGEFKIWHAFYGAGKQPVYITPAGSLDVADLVVNASEAGLGEWGRTLPDRALKMPISLVKNLTTSSVLLAAQSNNENSTARFIYIDAKNARELGVPEGYLREVSLSPENKCKVSLGKESFEVDFRRIPSVEAILNLSGSCAIYTKINEGGFKPALLQQLLESGNDFKVTAYELANKSVTTRDRRGVASTTKVAYNYKQYGLAFDLTLPTLNAAAPNYFRFGQLSEYYGKSIKLDGFTINRMF